MTFCPQIEFLENHFELSLFVFVGMGVAAYLCYFLALFEVVVWLADYPPYFNRGSWKHFEEDAGTGNIIGRDISRNVFFILAVVNSVPLLLAGLCEHRKSKWWMLFFMGLLLFFVVQQT